MLNISKGKQSRAQRVVIYGSEGIGKTTIAAKCPDPLFIDLENGSSSYDVARINGVNEWLRLLQTVEEVARTPNCCKTLVIDTMDKAEIMCIRNMLGTSGKKGIEDYGYGKGYTYLAEEYGKLLEGLDKVIAAGIHVVCIAHAAMRKFEQPDEMGAYDRWELKLSKKCAPLVKEWADSLLFLNYETTVIQVDGKAKASGGGRCIYTDHKPCWDAKNRHGLPSKVQMDYEAIKVIFEGPEASPKEQLEKLMADGNVDRNEVIKVIEAKGHTASEIDDDRFIKGFIVPYWSKIVETIENDPDRELF